jgi:hypothetical protein
MSWLANSPYGPLRNSSWQCSGCVAFGPAAPLDADPDAVRAAAVAHLEATGHSVSVARGTLEMLYPMATTAQVEEPVTAEIWCGLDGCVNGPGEHEWDVSCQTWAESRADLDVLQEGLGGHV